MPRDGNFISSGIKAGEHLLKYVRRAEAGDWNGLRALIDDNTLDVRGHPNAVILAAVTILTGLCKERGQSASPFVQSYVDYLKDPARSEVRESMRKIGLSLPSEITN